MPGTSQPASPQPDPRRWTALVFIAIAQLMVVLDATVVNIALPSAQAALHISDSNKQWVITAYTLGFGGLLLFGGRIADLWGRKQAFVIGLLGFAAASAVGGAAVNTGMLLAVMSTEAKERAKAFGIYSALAGAGAAIGLILGGVLTEYLNWRWALYINILFAVVAVVAAIGAIAVIHEPAGTRNRNRLDIPGVLLSTLGLVSLVYGFTRADSDGWSAATTIGMFVAAAALLLAFVIVESRVSAPLLPLRVVAQRNRGGIYLSLGLAVIGMFGLLLFLTYYLQIVLGYKAVTSGLAFLPLVAGMIIGSTQISARLLPRVSPRWLMGPGFLVASLGMLILTQIKTDSAYAAVVLPGLILMGLGLGTAFMPAMSLATSGVEPRDGVTSAMVNTSQQVGGSIGTALLNTVAVSATHSWATAHAASARTLGKAEFGHQALVGGYSTAIWWAFGILILSAVISMTLINTRVQSGPAQSLEDETAEDLPVPVSVH